MDKNRADNISITSGIRAIKILRIKREILTIKSRYFTLGLIIIKQKGGCIMLEITNLKTNPK